MDISHYALGVCFYGENEPVVSLSTKSAEFVDVTHTNPGVFGVGRPIGHVDLFANGKDHLQPGCQTDLCSHKRAWEFYVEAVRSGGDSFVSSQCPSTDVITAEACNGALFGFGASVPDSPGVYYLPTNAQSPYGTLSTPN